MAGGRAPANTMTPLEEALADCSRIGLVGKVQIGRTGLVGQRNLVQASSAAASQHRQAVSDGAPILPRPGRVRSPETVTAWQLSDALKAPRHGKRHWLSGATWEVLVRAELIEGHRLIRATCRMWPGRPPYMCPRRRCRIWSRREIVALCLDALKGDPLYPAAEIEALAAAALVEVQA